MSPEGYREGERKQEGKRRGKEVARRTDEGQVGEGFTYKLHYKNV